MDEQQVLWVITDSTDKIVFAAADANTAAKWLNDHSGLYYCITRYPSGEINIDINSTDNIDD